MTVFEEACLLSCEQWIDSFPTDIPKHDFSKNHQKMMNRLFDKMRNGKYHRFTKNTIKILLIAAILLSITTTALAVPSCREYIIKTLFDYSAYRVVDDGNSVDIDCLKLNYIPDDLRLSIDRDSKYFKSNYSLRTECERYNSRFKNTGQERMWIRNKASVTNLNTLAHISLLAVAVAAITNSMGLSYRKLKSVKRIA